MNHEIGKRYSFEKNPNEKAVVVRQAPPIAGAELFELAHKNLRGVASELLGSNFYITSKERVGVRDREYAMVVELPFQPIKLERLLREIAIKPNDDKRSIHTKEIAEKVKSLGDIAFQSEDDKWRVIENHAQRFSEVLTSSEPAVLSKIEQLCVRREDILEDILMGRFVRTYRDIAHDPPDTIRNFIDKLRVAVHDSDYLWGEKRIPPIDRIDRLFSRLGLVGPGAREAVILRVFAGLNPEQVEEVVDAHISNLLRAEKVTDENGKTAYVKSAPGMRVAAMSQNVATVISQGTMSQISIHGGEDGLEFDIKTKDIGEFVLIPVVRWGRDSNGFRYWNLDPNPGVSSAIIPIRASKRGINHRLIISSTQYNSLLGLMVFDLLHPDIKGISKRFGVDRRFEHPAMSLMGSLQRRDMLLESEILKRAERIVNLNGEEI